MRYSISKNVTKYMKNNLLHYCAMSGYHLEELAKSNLDLNSLNIWLKSVYIACNRCSKRNRKYLRLKYFKRLSNKELQKVFGFNKPFILAKLVENASYEFAECFYQVQLEQGLLPAIDFRICNKNGNTSFYHGLFVGLPSISWVNTVVFHTRLKLMAERAKIRY